MLNEEATNLLVQSGLLVQQELERCESIQRYLFFDELSYSTLYISKEEENFSKLSC